MKNIETADQSSHFLETSYVFLSGTLHVGQCSVRVVDELTFVRLHISPVGMPQFRVLEILCKFPCSPRHSHKTSTQNACVGISHRDQEVGGRLSIGRFVPEHIEFVHKPHASETYPISIKYCLAWLPGPKYTIRPSYNTQTLSKCLNKDSPA